MVIVLKAGCFYCDEPLLKEKTTTDHIIPKWLGGTNHPKNKVKCCLRCNSTKANFMPQHFAELIEWFFIPRSKNNEDKIYYRKVYLKCIDLQINHIPKYKNLMIKHPFANEKNS